jgi:hypothetical protein
MATAASATAIYGAVVASLALLVAGAAFIWNIVSWIGERRERRAPDVHGAVVVDHDKHQSVLVFANAGHGVARHLIYLLVENGAVYQGFVRNLFLRHMQQIESDPLPFASTSPRSTLVWAYMDADNNVHARSNNGDRYTYTHPTRVEVGEVFRRFYPGVLLPARPDLPNLGEL